MPRSSYRPLAGRSRLTTPSNLPTGFLPEGVDTRTGTLLAEYRLAPPDAAGQAGGYIDDVVLTPEGAWFTDARRHQLYEVPRTPTDAPAAVVIRCRVPQFAR
ncbi:hypothetical protein [Pseudonocardia sp. TRM90224]|uniref:hypothetical protein n=1 Tax=Pseudonocardia sp. TRM90224 TaxID=2812678 RepID=UPI001E49A7BB|nr:hypothetical protein [Pseudonocardia sp. TRM90224]